MPVPYLRSSGMIIDLHTHTRFGSNCSYLDPGELARRAKETGLDGVCITGGEPTLHKGLPDFIAMFKQRRFLVKLDTNGTNPEIIQEHLLTYYKTLQRLGKTIEDLNSECNRCKHESIDNRPIYFSTDTEMTECR